jgi:hypothetical protein
MKGFSDVLRERVSDLRREFGQTWARGHLEN